MKLNIIIGNSMLFGSFNNLKINIVFFFLFGYFVVNAQNLENEIYKEIDNFSINKTTIGLKKLDEKEKIFKKQVATKKEKLALVILLCNKAYYLKSINKQAIDIYENAWKLFSTNKLSNYDIIEYCLKPLGNLYVKSKNYTNAEHIIKHYIFLAEIKNNTNQQIAGMTNLSILYQSIGNHRKVTILTNELLEKKGLTSIQKEKIKNIQSHSLLFLEGNEPDSTTTNRSYFKYNQSLKNGAYKDALDYLIESEKKTKTPFTNRESAKFFLEKAQLLFLLKDTLSSQKTIQKCFNSLIGSKDIVEANLYAESLFTDAFDLSAELESDLSKKIKNYDFAFYVSHLLKISVTSQQAKIIHQNDNRKRSEKCIAILFELYNNKREKKYFEKALQYAKAYKSSVISEKIKIKTLLKKHPKDSLLLKDKYLMNQQEKLTNALIIEQKSLDVKGLIISDLSQKLNRISIDLKTIKALILEKYANEINPKIYLENLSSILHKKNGVLISYFYGKNALYQFVVKANGVEFNRIQLSEKTKKNIVDFIKFFDNASNINNDVTDYIEKAYRIYQVLKMDVSKHQKNIFIVPDGLLNFVPFEAMLTNTTKEVIYSKMPFLIKKSQVIYNININSFFQKQTSEKKDKVLGVFPVFSNTNKELKYSLEEAKVLNIYKGVDILLKEQATKQNFLKNKDKYNVLHLSTHAKGGSFQEVPTIDFYKETLTLNELYTLNLKSNLAILSACETGVGISAKGEGVLSISRGFQYAGVPNVLFSLWSINDKSTSIIMDYFYKELKKSNATNFANHQSKLLYLRNKDVENIKKSPYYWGAFVYYGIFEENEDTSSLKFILLSCVFLLVFFGVLYRKT